MSKLYPVAGWPGYSVNRLGQLYSEYGELSCDAEGRYRLRHRTSKKEKKLHVGTIMELAGLLVAVEPGQGHEDELAALRRERDALRTVEAELRAHLAIAEQTIARGRKLNGHLLHLVRGGQKVEKMVKPRGRPRTKCYDADEETLPEQLDFEDWIQ